MITVAFDGPFYIRYRDGEGPWTTPVATNANTYELHVTNAYDLVAVCGGLGTYDAEMLKRTFEDGASAIISCYASNSIDASPTAKFFTVDGFMQQAGEVWFADYNTSPLGPWSFSLEVPQGAHDLIAVGDTHMLIRRGIAVSSNMTLARVDVDVDGQPVDAVMFTTNAVPSETVRSSVDLETAVGFAIIDGSSSSLRTPPPSLLVLGDRVFARVTATTDTTSRSLRTPFTVGTTSLSLPTTLSGINYTFPYRQPWATWASLPEFTELRLSLLSLSSPAQQNVNCTARYLEATHTSYLSFYPLPDDYDTRFTVDFVGPYQRSFARYNTAPSGASDYSSIEEDVNLP